MFRLDVFMYDEVFECHSSLCLGWRCYVCGGI